MKKKCVICGADFDAPPSSGTVTCSKKCSSERKRMQKLSEPSKRIVKKCIICGSDFFIPPSMSGKYSTCSPSCRAEYSRRRTTVRRSAEKNWKKCSICGRFFSVPPSSTITTCRRRECTRAAHRNSAVSHIDTHLPEMQLGLATSPICQPDDRHHNARSWSLRAPDGKIYKFNNLNYFVKKHHELFSDDELKPLANNISKAVVCLRRLRPSLRHPSKHWHGWEWV